MPGISDFGFTMRPSRRDLVLVVADDPTARATIATRLQEDGYSVLSSSGPEEAMAMLAVTHASIVVAATARLGELKPPRPIPIVVVDDVEQVGEAVARALQRPAG